MSWTIFSEDTRNILFLFMRNISFSLHFLVTRSAWSALVSVLMLMPCFLSVSEVAWDRFSSGSGPPPSLSTVLDFISTKLSLIF